jgi:hypothetical protein
MLIHEAPWGAAFTLWGVPLVERGGSDYLANPTLAAGDVKVSKDGGAFTNLGTLPDAHPASGKSVRVQLSATEMEATFLVIDFIDQTSPKEWEDQRLIVMTELARGAIAGTVVADGSNTATTFDIGSTAADDVFNDRLLVFTTGALAGQIRKVTDFIAATDFIVVGTAFTAAPSAGDKFVLINR